MKILLIFGLIIFIICLAIRKQYYLEKLTICPNDCDYIGEEVSESNEINKECNLGLRCNIPSRSDKVRLTGDLDDKYFNPNC